jgi:hypothetical protein
MFISKLEKIGMETSIKVLESVVEKLRLEVVYLSAKVRALEGKTPKTKKPKKQSTMSAEGRARIGAAVKAYHAKKKLEKQNANSVSA